MLKIRQEQWNELGEPRRVEFAERAAQHVRKCWSEADEDWDSADLESFIDSAIEDAAELDIRTEKDVVRFIDILCLTDRKVLADRRYAWANNMLEQREIPANERLDAVWSRLLREIEDEPED